MARGTSVAPSKCEGLCRYSDLCLIFLQAFVELQAYTTTEAAQNAPLAEKELVRRLLSLMRLQAEGSTAQLLTVKTALTEAAPSVDNNRMIPLTW